MTKAVWVGPIRVLMACHIPGPAPRIHCTWRLHEQIGVVGEWPLDMNVCLLGDGALCEFRGWAPLTIYESLDDTFDSGLCTMPNQINDHDHRTNVYFEIEFTVPSPKVGAVIATAEQLGGDAWLEWLRGEGLLCE